MAEAFAVSVASSLLKSLVYLIKRQFEYMNVVVSIKRQFGYVISSESYNQDLQKEVGKLEYQADWVHIAVEEAGKKSQTVYIIVTEWQESVKLALKEAREFLGDFERASKTCCYGTLPDPSCRYQFSRMAMYKIEGFHRLAREGNKFEEMDDISFSPAPGNFNFSPAPGNFNLTSIKLREDGIFKSRALITQDIMGALADNKTNVVGVYGMGGVGKSTLLADIERRIREEKEQSFDWVVKADVSKNPDIGRIQGEIAYWLGFSNIMNQENVSRRAELLHRRLEDEERKKKKVLIILDNLWEGLDLKSVGIPCGHDNKVIGCKLLLTSRNREVLRWGMCCDKTFFLGRLKEEEARRLFERMVGDKVHDDKFKPWEEVVLDKCAGLPFLIVTVAKCFKDADLSEWMETFKKIGKPKQKGLNDLINNMLQLSCDYLGEEEKSFLQLCVIYGGSKPSLENLVKHGVDLGLFREYSSMEEARDILRSGIHTLKASSLLLEDGDADGFKIHDLVREFVISVAPRDRLLVLNDKDKEVTEYLRAKGTY